MPLPQSLQQNKSCQGDTASTSIHQAPEAGLRHGYRVLVTALHTGEAMQKGQALWYTDTNQDLPSCTLIYTAVSEVVGKLAANGKEEA